MSQITNLAATTELEAVNAMLAAIGESPITDLDAGQALVDVEKATNELRNATRDVQTTPWQFNTRFQVPLSPAGTTAWTDPDGTAYTLNVFTPPAKLASFTPSPTAAQNRRGLPLDLAILPSVVYTPGTLVFVDRTFNRDGLIQADFPKLYLDISYWLDFTQLPESARRYITILAGRRFIAHVLGSTDLVGFEERDEMQALRTLRREHGMEDTYNMFDTPDMARYFGGRPRTTGFFTDLRRGR